MPKVYFSIETISDSNLESQKHVFGNLIDNIWKDKFALDRGDIVDGKYIGTVTLFEGRPLRKKEKDELERRLNELNAVDQSFNVKVIYSKEKL